MTWISLTCRRLRWINLPGALLLALLQRAPALRVVAIAEEMVVASPLGALLRSAVAATATLGAMHSLAGATQFVQNPNNPVNGTVGQTVSVSFTITGSPTPPFKFTINNPLPPGLTTVPERVGNDVMSQFPTITGTPTQAGTFSVSVTGTDGSFSQDDVIVFQIAAGSGGGGTPPAITAQPTAAQAAAPGASATFTVAASGTPTPTIQWQRNGVDVFGATDVTFTVNNVQPSDVGIYRAVVANASGSVVTEPALLGLATNVKVVGTGTEVGSDIVFANGNIFDQVLLQGGGAAVTADPGQIVRISYLDLNDDIVQVEFTGAGTLSLVLDNVSGPAPPEKYNQPNVSYMKGHATIIVTGATEGTNLSVFSVGRANAVNQNLFKDVPYDGLADVAFIAIASSNGKFGGLRSANASYFHTRGFTGVYAPGVQFLGPVFIGDINASDNATPVLLLGAAPDVRITGGDLAQANSRAVQVSGFSQLRFADGSTSHSATANLPAQMNQGRLEQNGADVTQQIVVNPGP